MMLECIHCGKVIEMGLQFKYKQNKGYLHEYCADAYLPLIEDEINKPSHYHKGGIDVIGFAELHYSKEELKGFIVLTSSNMWIVTIQKAD
jgi:hypothetical protein